MQVQGTLRSEILLRNCGDLAQIAALSDARISAQSGGPEWRGIQLETGTNDGWIVDDLMYDGHLVGFNPSDDLYDFEIRHDSGWISAALPGGTFCIVPQGRPISVRRNADWRWGIAIVDGSFLDEVLGHHYELDTVYGIADDLLADLYRALLKLLGEPDGTRAGLTESLVRSFTLALGLRHGKPARELCSNRKLTPRQLNELRQWIDDNLSSALTVEQMSARIGVSPAYFSRLFKQATGLTPWEYVVKARVDRAAVFLSRGYSASIVAIDCGFSDQAHLSRLFKRCYGISPSTFARRA